MKEFKPSQEPYWQDQLMEGSPWGDGCCRVMIQRERERERERESYKSIICKRIPHAPTDETFTSRAPKPW